MQERQAEKTADLESLADALATFRQLHRDLDQWERVHLALGLAAVVSGCYGIGALEAALALTPEIERMPKVKLPTIGCGFSGLSSLPESRREAGFSAAVPGSGRIQFSGGLEWLVAAVDKRFPRNWISGCLNNLSCHTFPPAAVGQHRS